MLAVLSQFARRTALAAMMLMTGAPAFADTIQVPGSRISNNAPKGFVPAKGFTGLEHPSGASFLYGEFPGATYDQLAQAMTREALKRAKFDNAKPLKLERQDKYIAIEGEALDGAMSRFALLIADAQTVGFITANIPKDAFKSNEIKRDQILKALASITLVTARPKKEAFTLGYRGPFKFAISLTGTGSIYNLDGVAPDKPLVTFVPGFIVNIIPDSLRDGDADQGDGNRMLNVSIRSKLVITRSDEITIGKLKGWSHEATAMHHLANGSQWPVTIYAVFLEGPNGSMIWMEGSTLTEQAHQLMPEFRKIFASFSLRR